MAVAREIKRRIKTSKNISQVTRAMEMISGVKMRKSQDMAVMGRAYSKAIEKMLRVISNDRDSSEKSVFFDQPKIVKNILLVVIAPKKGLCGPLIGNLQRKVANFVLNNQEFKDANFSFITLGKKSFDVVKIFNQKIMADFEILEKGLEIGAITPISEFIVKELESGRFDAIYVAYTDFINTLTQKPVIKQFLPISKNTDEDLDETKKTQILFEPNSKEILADLVIKYSESMLYQFFLESTASEHSARMIAMKKAHDSADDIISELSLYYNKVRQNSITTELADSVSSRLGQEN